MTEENTDDGHTFEGNPVQVKQSEGVGRNVVDHFETALRRADKDRGTVVAFSFTTDAIEERAQAENEEGLKITLLKVKELLRVDGEIPQASTATKAKDGQETLG